jgi:hypothetical protein
VVDYAVDRFVVATNRRFCLQPQFHRDHKSHFNIPNIERTTQYQDIIPLNFESDQRRQGCNPGLVLVWQKDVMLQGPGT